MNKKRLLNSFIKYVKIDSLSKKESAMASVLKKELNKLGLSVKQDNAGKKIQGDCGNIFTTIKGNVKGSPRIMFNAHIDTVPPGNNIKPRIKGGYVVSNGKTVLGADNKAGVAVMMEAIRVIKGDKLPHGDIDILFTVAEEIGLYGAKNIDKAFLKADMGYVLDGGDVDEIINKAPSQDSIEVKIIGKAAHAGVHPEAGINAIKVAASAISMMKMGRIDKETTANIGIITGGIATNIIPEVVTLKGEARSHNIKKLKKQVGSMKKCFQSACKKFKAKLEFNIIPSYRAFNIKTSDKVLVTAVNSARALRIKPIIKMTGGGSDANIFSSKGLPCVIIGAGADRVHTVNERASISHMNMSVELLLEIIKETVKCAKRH